MTKMIFLAQIVVSGGLFEMLTTDIRMDNPSYRDARTHFKRQRYDLNSNCERGVPCLIRKIT